MIASLLATGAAVAATPTPAPAAGAFVDTHAIVSLDSDERDVWDDVLLFYLLLIYEKLGGNPDTIDMLPPVECSVAVGDYYWKNGMKPNLTDEEEAEFRSVIEATALHLYNAPPGVEPSSFSSFRAALDGMYEDVGGDPDTLP